MDPKAFLAAIAAKCPSNPEHRSDCPLRVLRPEGGVSAEARLAALPEAEADELVRSHFLCVCRKNGCAVD